MRTARANALGLSSSVALVALVLASCSADKETTASPTPDVVAEVVEAMDVPTTPDTKTDTGRDTKLGPQMPDQFDPCANDSDCESGHCLRTPNGSVCTQPCLDSCPNGFWCRTVAAAGSARLCVPANLTLCLPCNTDDDCVTVEGSLMVYEGARCISYGDSRGSFCGARCTKNSDCPDGYGCDPVTVGGKTTTQCVPHGGECECSQLAEELDASTTCVRENAAGTCTGKIECVGGELSVCNAQKPKAEVCDGVDNDCSGVVDDNLADLPAAKSVGVCSEARKVCVNGDWQEPDMTTMIGYQHVETKCDGLDNDCDGLTDNGPGLVAPPAAEQDGVCAGAKRVCGGTKGWVEPNYAVMPGYQVVESLCDELDNDCDGFTDAADKNFAAAPAAKQSGVCAGSVRRCEAGGVWIDPDYSEIEGYEEVEVTCDGLDNDCDGQVDEPFAAEATGTAKLGQPCGSGICAGGIYVCNDEGTALVCSTADPGAVEMCDNIDNDCNPDTPDGMGDPSVGKACDGPDGDLCKDDLTGCAGGAIVCNDVDTGTDYQDLCDGIDNDCNPATPDGSTDPAIGAACDGPDADLCANGISSCKDGVAVCNEVGKAFPDLCDTQDNDCNPDTPDGSGEPTIGQPCDGDDDDLCKEGVVSCAGGSLLCDDPNEPTPDLCDGVDNDCNPLTLDGSGDPQVGKPCDGDDADLCTEGTWYCAGGELRCNDMSSDTPDLCDGVDNDCNPATPDGQHDPTIGKNCDGADADLCKEGKLLCENGIPTCSDPNDADPDICDGQDNDCNPATDDGSGDPLLGTQCDGDDADLCEEGIRVCHNASLKCSDDTGDIADICDGVDNDCNPDTPDGSGHEGIGAPCDGDDEDLCNEGVRACEAGSMVCTDDSPDNQEVCDGEDNDCNPETPDGQDDAQFLAACDRDPEDGGDMDLCEEGEWTCTAGTYVCVEDIDDAQDLCDGIDNDCNPVTPDGGHDASLGTLCDGDDIDLCTDGVWKCQAGVVTCTDDPETALDLCNGEDEDCNPGTLDGQHEAMAGVECDGPDTDLCKEGFWLCVGGQMQCTDESADNLDLCDGFNRGQDDTKFLEDCDPSTQDGYHEMWLHTDCDTDADTMATDGSMGDIDLCKEGVWQCHQGEQVCDDNTDSNQDLCNGLDDDCDPSTPDGYHSPYINDPVNYACDGHVTLDDCPKDPSVAWCSNVVDDIDHCREGVYQCENGRLQCVDETDSIPDLCDGMDNDCNPVTLDGVDEPPQPGVAHTCEEADTIPVIEVTGSGVIVTKTGRFNSVAMHDYYKVVFTRPAPPAAFRPRIGLRLGEESQYRLRIMTSCGANSNWTGCPTSDSTPAWNAEYTYNSAGPVGDKTDLIAPPTTLYVRVSKPTLNENGQCQGYTLDFSID